LPLFAEESIGRSDCMSDCGLENRCEPTVVRGQFYSAA